LAINPDYTQNPLLGLGGVNERYRLIATVNFRLALHPPSGNSYGVMVLLGMSGELI
jgi:hypothetical protein